MAKSRKSTKKSNGLLFNRLDFRSVLPFLVIFAAIGGYFIWQTFAYSYEYCSLPNNYNRVYRYDTACLRDSDESKIVRIYYTTLGRAPGSDERELATSAINGTKGSTLTLTQVASELMKKSEFKTKFNSLTNENFIKQIYQQALSRQPSSAELTFVKAQLGNTVDQAKRATFIASLSENDESKTKSEERVVSALYIQLKSSNYQKSSTGTPVCLGTTQSEGGNTWCNVKIKDLLLPANTSYYKHVPIVRIPKSFPSSLENTVIEMDMKLRNTSTELGKTIADNHGGVSLIPYSGTFAGSNDFTTKSYTSEGGNTISSKEKKISASSDMPKGTSGMLITFSAYTDDQTKALIESLPSNALISVKMPSLEFYTSKSLRNVRIPQDQTTTKYATYTTPTFHNLSLGGRIEPLPIQIPYTPINKKAGNTDWAHTAPNSTTGGLKTHYRVSGTSRLIGNGTAHTVKFKVRLYRSGKAVPANEYSLYVYKNYKDYKDDKYVKLSRDKSGYFKHKDYDWRDTFYVSIKQKYAGTLKVVFDVVSPSTYKFTQSYFSPYEFRR